MNLIKQLQFDFRSGLTRKQYLLTCPILLLSCLLAVTEIESCNLCLSTLDFFLYSFAGSFPIFSNIVELELQIPTIWLLIVNGCLYINIGYIVSDFSVLGIQRIIRCTRRYAWFFSKCIWIIVSCMLYLALAFLMIFFMQIGMYGEITFAPSIQVLNHLTNGITVHNCTITIADGIIIGIILPLITIITYSFFEFVMLFYTKPIISFVFGIAFQVVALCYQSAFVVGNGAMVVRNSILISSGVTTGELLGVMMSVNFLLIIIGYYRFSRMDILEVGE